MPRRHRAFRSRHARSRLALAPAALLILALALAGCGLETPPPSTGHLPANAFGNAVIGEGPAMAAISDAAYAFAHPQSMQGKPAQMALAVASLDAMAGQFSTSGRWSGMNSLIKMQMLQARSKVRGILGIPDSVPSQTVINAMVAASHALADGDRKRAESALSVPAFTRSPARMIAILAHFPRVPLANVATMRAQRHFLPGGGGSFHSEFD